MNEEGFVRIQQRKRSVKAVRKELGEESGENCGHYFERKNEEEDYSIGLCRSGPGAFAGPGATQGPGAPEGLCVRACVRTCLCVCVDNALFGEDCI